MSNNTVDSVIDIGDLTLNEAMDLYEALKKKLGKGGAPVRVKRDYESWDWTKKNKELAAEHGVQYSYVCLRRRLLGKPKVPGGKHYPACLGWDWAKSDTEIARETGVGVMQVRGWRRKLNKPSVPRDNRHSEYTDVAVPMMPTVDFSGVDWDKSDVEIAHGLKCSREYVRQKRAQLKIPKHYFYDRKYETFVEMFGDSKGLRYADVKKAMPIGQQTFKKYCVRAGVEVLWSGFGRAVKHPWAQMNWKLPNLILSEVWGIKVVAVANQRSKFPTLGKAEFQMRQAHGVPAEHHAMVEKERAKAQTATQTLTHTPSSDDQPQPVS